MRTRKARHRSVLLCLADARYHGAEIRYGPFRLEVSLPSAIDRDRVTARYEGGFLCASLPKIDRSRP